MVHREATWQTQTRHRPMSPIYIYLLLAFCVGLLATIPAYLWGRAYTESEVVLPLKSIDLRLGRLERTLCNTEIKDPTYTTLPIGYIGDRGEVVNKVLRIKHKNQYRCAICNKVLTWNQVMNSHGTCPICGAITPNSTVVKTIKESILI